ETRETLAARATLARPGDELVHVFADVQRDVFIGEQRDLALIESVARERFHRIVREQPRALDLGGLRLWVRRIDRGAALVRLGWAWFVTGMFHPRQHSHGVECETRRKDAEEGGRRC